MVRADSWQLRERRYQFGSAKLRKGVKSGCSKETRSTNTITFLARFRAHQKLLRMFSDQRQATPRAALADGEPKIGTQLWERISAIT